MESRITTKNEMKNLGIEVQTSNQMATDPTTARIPEL